MNLRVAQNAGRVPEELQASQDLSSEERDTFAFRAIISGYAIAQLVEAPRFKPEDRGFDWVKGH